MAKRFLTRCLQYHVVRTEAAGKGKGKVKPHAKAANSKRESKDNSKTAPPSSKTPGSKDNSNKQSSGEKQEASNDSLQQSPSESGEGISEYERKREDNIEKNNQTLQQMGILRENAGDSNSPTTRTGGPTGQGGKKTKETAKKGQASKPLPETTEHLQSPAKGTRQQIMLQQQQISVVWGGELHCSNPLHPTTYCAYWPLDSLGLTRLMVWLGTTALNRTVPC